MIKIIKSIIIFVLFSYGLVIAQYAERGSRFQIPDADTINNLGNYNSEIDIAHEENIHYQLREPSEEKIQKYLEDKDLNYFQDPEIDKNWIERIYDWINSQIRSIMMSDAYSTAMDFLIYIIMIAALIIIILGLLKSDIRGFLYGSAEKKLKGISEKTEDITKIDFNELISQALGKNDYKLAVRYNYLKILITLSKVGALDLREFKTSSQLVSELKNKDKYYEPFKNLTRIFENIWYGDHKVEEGFYKKISEDFNRFDNLVRENG